MDGEARCRVGLRLCRRFASAQLIGDKIHAARCLEALHRSHVLERPTGTFG